MGNLSRINQPLYTKILREILKSNSYDEVRNILQKGESTFSEEVRYLISLNLVRTYKRRLNPTKSIYIYYPGINSYLLTKHLPKYLRAYYKEENFRNNVLNLKNFKPPKILYKDEILSDYIKRHLQYELIERTQEIGIKELFERVIFEIGNWCLEGLRFFPKMRKQYRKAKRNSMVDSFNKLYEGSDYKPHLDMLNLENAQRKTKEALMEEAYNLVDEGAVKEVEVRNLIVIFSLIEVAIQNRINLQSLFTDYIPKKDYLENKDFIDSAYSGLRTA